MRARAVRHLFYVLCLAELFADPVHPTAGDPPPTPGSSQGLGSSHKDFFLGTDSGKTENPGIHSSAPPDGKDGGPGLIAAQESRTLPADSSHNDGDLRGADGRSAGRIRDRSSDGSLLSWAGNGARALLKDLLRPENTRGQNADGALRVASPLRWAAPDPDRGPPPSARSHPGAELLRSKQIREAMLRFKIGDPIEAEKRLTARLERFPADGGALILRALSRLKSKDARGALEDASQAARLKPWDAWPYEVRGLALMELGRAREAVEDYGRALQADPRDARALAGRALAHARLGRKDRALEDLGLAAELDSKQFQELYAQALRERHPAPAVSGGFPAYAWYGIGAFSLILAGVIGTLSRNPNRLSNLRAIRNSLARFTPPPGWDAPAALQPSNGAIAAAAAGSEALATPRPRTVGNYEVLGKLGRGGMGEVYEAMDLVLRRKVALKKMLDAVSADSRERRHFIREARMVAALKHPHIVEIYSVIEPPDGLYLVFEHIPGEPLHRVLDRRKSLAWPEALGLLRQVAAALDYAHSQGVVHRDMKPSNIMVCGENAKVMDFGIARNMLQTLSTRSRGEVAGTTAYMAPEQERGEARRESDLYALGICLYEMLAGDVPFPDAYPYPKKVRGEFQPLSRAVPSLPEGIDAVMRRALDPEPGGRYATAGQFSDALRRLRPVSERGGA